MMIEKRLTKSSPSEGQEKYFYQRGVFVSKGVSRYHYPVNKWDRFLFLTS